MAKSRILPLIALAAAPMLAGCAGDSDAPADNEVRMIGVRFDPQNLTVPTGTEVVWVNKSSLVHTVTSDDPSGPLDSGDVGVNGEYRYTFTTPGTHAYHCVPHSTAGDGGTYVGMIGTITVTP